jgi:hypothetical protein
MALITRTIAPPIKRPIIDAIIDVTITDAPNPPPNIEPKAGTKLKVIHRKFIIPAKVP